MSKIETPVEVISKDGLYFIVGSDKTIPLATLHDKDYAQQIADNLNSHDEAMELLKDSEKYSEHIKSCVLNSRSELKPCDCGRANWIERKSQLLAKMKEV